MSEGNGVLEFAREEDFIEYYLFPPLITQNNDEEKIRNNLENILKQIQSVIADKISQYIWHKDEFILTARTEKHFFLTDEDNKSKEILPPHLYGVTHYGDNIQDEWFIVYLIYEITRKIPGIIGRVFDSDGEFLLIEAANFLPKWADPDTCEQRVYIFNGYLQLVQNSPSNTKQILPISTGISKIWQNPTLYKVPKDIQQCIDSRLSEFEGDKFNQLFHYQIVRVPFAIAGILKAKPTLIAPACRAFCERDVIDMKACRAMRYFPPENRVRTRIKFTRCLYAMLMHNNYTPDRRIGWNLPKAGTEEFKEDILGVKIACGFEILAAQARKSKNEDDDIECDRSWKTYLNSLVKRGYFQNFIENSKDYCRLMNEAKSFYKENRDRFKTAPIVGKEILSLLTNLDINLEQLRDGENNLQPSQSDDWLNISSDQLDEMLTSRYGINKLYNTTNGNINATEFTRNISEFLNAESCFDGIDIDETVTLAASTSKNSNKTKEIQNDNHYNTKTTSTDEISFDPDSFQTHVKKFLDFVIPEDDWESQSGMSDYEDDNGIEKNIEDMVDKENGSTMKIDLKAYMDQMDRELSKTTIGKTFENKSSRTKKRLKRKTTASNNKNIDSDDIESSEDNYDEDDFDDIESFKPIDIDVNTLRNMMDSYKSQGGGSGPVSNLLGAMGIGMKRSESNATVTSASFEKDNKERKSNDEMDVDNLNDTEL